MPQFNEQLKALRKGRNMSHSQLAQAIGVAASAISNYESGRVEPTIQTLTALAAYFQVSTDFLLGLAETTPKGKTAKPKAEKKSRGESTKTADGLRDLIFRLCTAYGPAGEESGAADLAAEELKKFGPVTVDRRGSVLCRMGKVGAERRILLDAHLDQIGMIVTDIDENGFLQIARCGGVDRRVLPGAPVLVYGKEVLTGVVCCTPPHLSDGKAPVPAVDKMNVDLGLSAEQVKKLVTPGDRILPWFQPMELLNGRISSAALDDRAGCAALLRCAELLQGAKLDWEVCVQLSVQEEVGGKGADNGAFAVEPNQAIVVDVSFAEQPNTPAPKCGKLGGGPMIGAAPVLSRSMGQSLAALAEKLGMPWKWDVMGGDTGTNCDGVATSRAGVETVLLSIPLRYMHTPIEVIDLEDVENTARLMAEYIKALGGKERKST